MTPLFVSSALLKQAETPGLSAMSHENTDYHLEESFLSRTWWRYAILFVFLYASVKFVAARSRAVCFYFKYASLFLSYIVFGVLFIPVLALKPGSPKNAWWLTKYGEYLQLPLFGIGVKRKGCPYPDGPCVIVCNHQSALDSVVMMHEKIWPGDCVVIMKNSMKYTGPFGLCLVLAGTIFVNRKNSASAKEMMRSAADAIQENKYRVWIFPEGTRKLSIKGNIEEHFLPFKKGAFNLAVMAQVPVVPVVFSSQEKFFSVHRHIFEPGETTATVLPALSTEGMTLEDVPRLTDEVRTKMLQAFTNH